MPIGAVKINSLFSAGLKLMQDTDTTASEPLRKEDYRSYRGAAKQTTVCENEPESSAHHACARRQELVMWILLVLVIIINLLVLISIILCN
jgi:hypothetical protein